MSIKCAIKNKWIGIIVKSFVNKKYKLFKDDNRKYQNIHGVLFNYILNYTSANFYLINIFYLKTDMPKSMFMNIEFEFLVYN